MKNLLKRSIAILIAAMCLVMPLSVFVYAEEETEAIESHNTMSGDETAAYVEDLIQYLSLNTRYDRATTYQLCYEALMGILREHPEMFETAVKAMLSYLDEYSVYMSPEEVAALQDLLNGTFVGIGVILHQQGDKFVIGGFMPDTPASTSGLKEGDVIVTVDGVDVTGMTLDSLTGYIRGPLGTAVTIGVTRDGVEGILSFTIVRVEVHNSVLSTTVVGEGESRTMYMALLNFSEGCSKEVTAALDRADAEGISNVIFDLRDNGGGVFEEAIMIASLFLPSGKTIVTEDHKVQMFNRTYVSSNTRNKAYNTVVLINENTASASEVLTAALKENDAAIVMGVRSYGKSTVQNVVGLPDGAAMKYTAAFYLTPLGNNINEVGITPDVIVENEYIPLDITPYTEFSYERVWAKGDVGADVKYAKEILSVWGLYNGPIDETFDEELEAAVTTFQSATGLYPYGVLDLTTQGAIYNQLKITKVVVDNQLEAAFNYFGIVPDNTEE